MQENPSAFLLRNRRWSVKIAAKLRVLFDSISNFYYPEGIREKIFKGHRLLIKK